MQILILEFTYFSLGDLKRSIVSFDESQQTRPTRPRKRQLNAIYVLNSDILKISSDLN